MSLPRIILAAALALPALPAIAHEFWIKPLRYQVANDQNLQGFFINGEEFEGTKIAYFDRSSERFELRVGDQTFTLRPRPGDSPALRVYPPKPDALAVVAYESKPTDLTYSEWEKFQNFVKHKDFRNALADHEAAGWPKEDFGESYSRHVKSLIAVGSGEGSDSEAGLKTEFVALTNPYTEDFDNRMKVRLLYEGAPRADAQVEVFERAPDGSVDITLHRTDEAGEAVIPVQDGHEYLFDAVVLRPYERTGEDDPVWQTLWAALTFAVPD